MANNENLIPIPGRLHSVATEGHVAGAEEIYDDALQKDQATINQEVNEALGDGGTVDEKIEAALEDVAFIDDSEPSPAVVPEFNPESDTVHVTAQTLSESQKQQVRENIGLGDVDAKINEAVASEASQRASAVSSVQASVNAESSRAQAAEADRYTKSETYTKTEVNGLVDTPHQEYVTVDAYASLPASGSKDTIYRVSNYNGSTSQVDASVYSEYAWNGSQYVFLCVKSQIGEVFDISVYNNNAKYADLAAALNGGANIPQSLQKGGMSVKFVQSSDNKYIQYRLMSDTFSTTEGDWQGVDEVPTIGSKNLVESGEVAVQINNSVANKADKKYLSISQSVLPIETSQGYFYNAVSTTNVGDVITLVSKSVSFASKYPVEYGEEYDITLRQYGKYYYVIFTDADMKFISGNALSTDNLVHQFTGKVVVPKGSAYMLINTYSAKQLITLTNKQYESAKKIDVEHLKSVYTEKEIQLNRISGTFEVDSTTPLGSQITILSKQYHYIVEVNKGDAYRVTTNVQYKNNHFYACIFVDDNMALLGAAGLLTGTGNQTFIVDIPDGVHRMLIHSYNGSTSVSLINDIQQLSGLVGANRDIIPLVNGASNYPKINRTSSKNFSMYVMTDIHGDAERFNRYCDALTYFDAIDVGICLGDIVSQHFNEDIEWYVDAVNALPKPYFTVIGNHDAGNTNSIITSGTVQQCFEKYIEPTLDKIGDETLDKTYYAKMFDDYKIALIVLNVFDSPDTLIDASTFAVSRTVECISQAQVDWFVNTLNSIPANYHLVLCYHFIDDYVDGVECNFTDDYYNGTLSPLNQAYQGLIGDIVAVWIAGGTMSQTYSPSRDTNYLPVLNVNCDFSNRGNGIFVGHFIGHLHRDFVGKLRTHQEQSVIGFGYGCYPGSNNMGDMPRLIGTKSEDLTTLVTIDTINRAINLIRIGANVTYKLVDRTKLRITY